MSSSVSPSSPHRIPMPTSSYEYEVHETDTGLHRGGPRMQPLRLVVNPDNALGGLGLAPRLRPLLRAAARANDLPQVRDLLDRHHRPGEALSPALLEDVCQGGHPEMISEGLRRGLPISRALRETTEADALTEQLRRAASTAAPQNRSGLFMLAAEAGDWPLLAALMQDHGFDPASHGGNALKRAARFGRHEVVRRLMPSCELVNPGLKKLCRPWVRKYPVTYAVRSGSVPTLRVLVEAGADPRAYVRRIVVAGREFAAPMLSVAAVAGHVEMIRALCTLRCDVDGEAGSEPWPPLEVALRSGKLAAAAELVLQGASASGVNARWTASLSLRAAESAVLLARSLI